MFKAILPSFLWIIVSPLVCQIIPISIQTCCYFSHIKAKPFLSPIFSLGSLDLRLLIATVFRSCIFSHFPISLLPSLFNPVQSGFYPYCCAKTVFLKLTHDCAIAIFYNLQSPSYLIYWYHLIYRWACPPC